MQTYKEKYSKGEIQNDFLTKLTTVYKVTSISTKVGVLQSRTGRTLELGIVVPLFRYCTKSLKLQLVTPSDVSVSITKRS